jgi:hypothetical protein
MQVRAIPPALVAAIAMSLISNAVALCSRVAEGQLPMRAIMIAWGAGVAELVLLSAGLFELSRRLDGAARRCAHAAGAIFAVFLLWRLCRDALVVLDGQSRVELFHWSLVPHGVLSTAAAALIATAVSGWTRAPVASVVSILVVLGQGWVPWLGDELYDLLRAHPTAEKLYWLVLDLCSTLALIQLIAVGVRDREATLADPVAAASGARIAAVALWLRLGLAIVLALPLLMLLRMPGLPAVIHRVTPLVDIALAVLCAAGLLRLAGSRIEGLPASRLTAGATLVLWWAGIELTRLSHYADLSRFTGLASQDTELLEGWSIAGPLISVAGLVLAGTSIAAWAEARGALELRQSAVSRTIVLAILSTFSVPLGLGSIDSLGLYALISLLSIAGLVAFAGLMSRAAEMLASGPTLPSARVLSATERRGDGSDPGASADEPRM